MTIHKGGIQATGLFLFVELVVCVCGGACKMLKSFYMLKNDLSMYALRITIKSFFFFFRNPTKYRFHSLIT